MWPFFGKIIRALSSGSFLGGETCSGLGPRCCFPKQKLNGFRASSLELRRRADRVSFRGLDCKEALRSESRCDLFIPRQTFPSPSLASRQSMNGRKGRDVGMKLRWGLFGMVLLPFALAVLGNTAMNGQDDSATNDDSAALRRAATVPLCEGFVTVKRRAQIAAPDSGIVERIEVEPGSLVEQGQVLGQLDRNRQRLERDLAQARLDAALATVTEDASRKLAYAEAIAAEQDHLDRIAAPGVDLDLAEAAAWRRRLLVPSREPLEAQRLQQATAAAERDVVARQVEFALANERVEVGTITAPFRGIVVQRFRQSGEWITAGDALCELLDLDQLKVEGAVKADQIDPRSWIGKSCELEIMEAGGTWQRLAGKIDRVGETIDAAGRIKIEASFDNRRPAGGYRFAPGSPAKLLSVAAQN